MAEYPRSKQRAYSKCK